MVSIGSKERKNSFVYLLVLSFLLALTLFASLHSKVFSEDTATTSPQTPTLNEFQKQLRDMLNEVDSQKKPKYSRIGIFGCKGGVYAPVGLMGPDDAYVPVFDKATHSQIQLLTYKECVLDPVMTHLANSILAKTVATQIDMINKQNLVIGNINKYLKDKVRTPTVKEFVSEVCVKKMNKSIAPEVCAQIAKDYLETLKNPYKELECDLSETELNKIKQGIASGVLLQRFINQPACSKSSAYSVAKNALLREIAAREEREKFHIGDSGFAPIKAKVKEKYLDEDGQIKERWVERVVTPASVVAGQANLLVGSAIRKLEQTDEIDEMIQSFFSMLGARVLDATQQGFYGINKVLDGNDSYLSSLVNQEEQIASKYKASVAGLSLVGMIKNEKEFLKYKLQTIDYILNAIHNIRNNEEQCFEKKIIPGAKEALSESVSEALCPAQNNQNNQNQNQCSVSVSIKSSILPGYVDIKEKQSDNSIEHGVFVVSGKENVQGGTGTISIVNDKNKATSTSFVVSSPWFVEFDSKSIPNGDLNLIVNYPGGRSSETSFFKDIIVDMPILTLPKDRYKIKIEATGKLSSPSYGQVSEKTETVILKKDRRYSDPYTNKNSDLFRLLQQNLKDIDNARYVLAKLYEIAKDSKSNPTLATYKIDLLVSKRIVHTSSDVLSAKESANNLSGNLQNLVESILRDSWEADGRGWCNKSAWQEFESK